VETAISLVTGVEKVEVIFAQKKARVWGSASVVDLIDAVEMVGFDATEDKHEQTTRPDQVLTIEGMMCQKNCGTTVETAISLVTGVEKVEVIFSQKKARVWGSASVVDLIDAVEMVGFDAVNTQQTVVVAASAQKSNPPRDESLPCASFSILGDTSAPNLRSLKKRLYSLSGVQHIELIPLSSMVEVSFHESVTSANSIAQSAADPFNNSSCRLTLLNTTGLKSQRQQQCEVSLEITGMSCAACVVKTERALRATAGVELVTVNLATKRAVITYSGSPDDSSKLADIVIKLGFNARVANEELSSEALQKSQNYEINQWKTLMVIALLFTLPLMVIKISTPYSQWLMSSQDGFGAATRSELLQAALATPVQIFVGYRFYVAAFKGLMAEHRSMGMDFLVAAGTSISFFYSWFSLANLMLAPVAVHLGMAMSMSMSASHHIFFDASAMLLTFITFGKTLEALSTGRTTDALTKLMNLQPKTAILLVPVDDSNIEEALLHNSENIV